MADIIADTGFRTDLPNEITAFHNNIYGQGVYLADSSTTALAERPNGTMLKVSGNAGKHGYLYSLEKLIDAWNVNDKITTNVTEKFEKKLNEITQHNVTVYN